MTKNLRQILSIAVLTLFSLTVLNCTIKETAISDQAANQIKVGESWQVIKSGNMERRYLLYVPTIYDGSMPFPLVLNFHGSGGDPEGQLAYSDFANLADEKNFVVALPFGEYRLWGSRSWNTTNDSDEVNDVLFTLDIISDLSKKLNIDPDRIYATGMSGGARMTSRLACDLDDVLAAVAPVAGIQFPPECKTHGGMPIITFHSKNDEVNPFEHGKNSPPYWTAGVEESLAGWVDMNGCEEAPQIFSISDAVARLSWENCRDNAEIVFYLIEDGGHTWPSEASKLIWEFFQEHSLP